MKKILLIYILPFLFMGFFGEVKGGTPSLYVNQVGCSDEVSYLIDMSELAEYGEGARISYDLSFQVDGRFAGNISNQYYKLSDGNPSGNFTLEKTISGFAQSPELRAFLEVTIQKTDFSFETKEVEKNFILDTGPKLVINEPASICANFDLTDPKVVAGSDGGYFEYFEDENLYNKVADPKNVGPGTYWIKLKRTPTESCFSKEKIYLKREKPAAPELEYNSCEDKILSVKILFYTKDIKYIITPKENVSEIQADTTFTISKYGEYSVRYIDPATGCESEEHIIDFQYKNRPEIPIVDLVSSASCTNTNNEYLIKNYQESPMAYELQEEGSTEIISINPYPDGNFSIESKAQKKKYKLVAIKEKCRSDEAVIEVDIVPDNPQVPTVKIVSQPECEGAEGVVRVTNTEQGVEYSLDGVVWQASGEFLGVRAGTYTIKARKVNSPDCKNESQSFSVVEGTGTLAKPTGIADQPNCNYPFGKVIIDKATDVVQYSLDGVAWQVSNVFSGLPSGDYYMYVKNDAGCKSKSDNPIVIKKAPNVPQIPVLFNVISPKCEETTGTVIIEKQVGVEYSLDGENWQQSNVFAGLLPGSYSLYVRGVDGHCERFKNNGAFVKEPEFTPQKPIAEKIVQPICEKPGYMVITPQNGAEYSIDGENWQTSNVFINLGAGKYTLYVRGSKDHDCVVVSDNTYTLVKIDGTSPAPEVVKIDPNCDNNTGRITVISPIGMGYQYRANDGSWQDSRVFDNLKSGEYYIFVKNTNGCITPTKKIIKIKEAPVIPQKPRLKEKIDPSCQEPKGTIEIEAQENVLYSVDGFGWQVSPTFSSLPAGDYTLQVKGVTTDPNIEGCLVKGETVKIVEAPGVPEKPTATVLHPTCNEPTGVITILPKKENLQYSVDRKNWQDSNEVTGLASGSYMIYVKDKKTACENYSDNFVVINKVAKAPEIPVLDKAVNPICQNPTGFILIKSQPGVLYSIDGENWQESSIFSGVKPGEYRLYVKNKTADGCISMAKDKVVINEAPIKPSKLEIESVVQPDCNVSTGKVVIKSQDNLEYSLDGIFWQDSNVFLDLIPKKYVIRARNKESLCEVATTVEIILAEGIPELPKVKDLKHPNCDPLSKGSIIVEPQDNVEYRLDNGNWQPFNIFTNVESGEHLIYVRSLDGLGCESVSNEPVVINESPLRPEVPEATVYNPDCDRAQGTIIVKPQDNAEYQITGFPWQTDTVFENVPPGKYLVKVRGENNEDWECWQTSDVEYKVGKRPKLPFPPTVSAMAPSCGQTLGTIVIRPQDNVEYSLDGETWTSTHIFKDKEPNNYNAYVRHLESGCIMKTDEFPLSPGAKKPELPKVTVTQPDCNVDKGIITIEETEGLVYRISGFRWTTTNVFTDLDPGAYEIFARSLDDVDCYADGLTVLVEEVPKHPKKPEVENISDMICEESTGSFKLVYQPDVEYSIDGVNWTTEHEFIGLSPGTYTVTAQMTTGAMCTETATVTIKSAEGAPKLPKVTITEPSCEVSVGALNFEKVADVEYSIDGGSSWTTTNVFQNLDVGTYIVQVRSADEHCVSSIERYEIKQAKGTPLVPALENVNQPSCSVPTGQIEVSRQDSVVYSLDQKNWQESNLFQNLVPGDYTIYVKSLIEGECISSSNFTIKNPPKSPDIPILKELKVPTCETPYGEIVVEPQQDVEYSIDGVSWQVDNTFKDLVSGKYPVYVRRGEDCIVSSEKAFDIPQAPESPANPIIFTVEGNDIIDATERKNGVTVSGKGNIGDTITIQWEGFSKTIIAEKEHWYFSFEGEDLPEEKQNSEITVVAKRSTCSRSSVHVVSFSKEIIIEKGYIVANDDDMSEFPVDNETGSNFVVDIFSNDTNEGILVEKEDVNLTIGEVTLDGKLIESGDVQINPSGFVSVVSGASQGVYKLRYTICDKFHTARCDDAVVTVVVGKECKGFAMLKIPEFLSINDDDKNEKWEIKGLKSYTENCGDGGNIVMIFNRKGKMLYKKENYMFDGERFEGIALLDGNKKLSTGTYLFVLEVKGMKEQKTGFLFLHKGTDKFVDDISF